MHAVSVAVRFQPWVFRSPVFNSLLPHVWMARPPTLATRMVQNSKRAICDPFASEHARTRWLRNQQFCPQPKNHVNIKLSITNHSMKYDHWDLWRLIAPHSSEASGISSRASKKSPQGETTKSKKAIETRLGNHRNPADCPKASPGRRRTVLQ